ncbi:hypothetical protein BH23BAC1_BH23BAC1_27080 [soil metagenome]
MKSGGKLNKFGPVDHSGEAFMEFLNLHNKEPLEGELQILSNYLPDQLNEKYSLMLNQRPLFSGGEIRTIVKNKNDTIFWYR